MVISQGYEFISVCELELLVDQVRWGEIDTTSSRCKFLCSQVKVSVLLSFAENTTHC